MFPPSQQWDTGPSQHTDHTLGTGKNFNLDQAIINLLLELTTDLFRSWDGYVNIVIRIWAGWSKVRFPAGAEDFSLFKNVQIGSGTHPASYSIVLSFSVSTTVPLHCKERDKCTLVSSDLFNLTIIVTISHTLCCIHCTADDMFWSSSGHWHFNNMQRKVIIIEKSEILIL